MRGAWRLALAAATAGWAGGAAAQPAEIPQAISPLQVQSDHNNVNLVSGRTTIDGPVLSVPAAPNLVFDRVQNAAPYIVGRVSGQGGESPSGNWTAHLGNGRSESFQCSDSTDCDSVTGSGSTLGPSLTLQGTHATYRQAGTGAVWHFNRTSVAAGETRQSYASSVSHPNGETISYDYQTVTSGPVNQIFHRPERITSNLGYHITLAYQGQDFGADPGAWATVSTATLYLSSEPDTPLRRLTFGGGTVIDSGTTVSDMSDDRAYVCPGCGGTLGADVETWSGSLQLPGEGAPMLQVASQPDRPLVQTVARDGVAWTYTYLDPHQEPGQSGWFYDRVTVTGPNGFSQAYRMAKGGPARARHLMIEGVTDSLQRQTLYRYDGADRPIEITYPEGNRVSVQYDEMGNIVSRTRHPPPGQGEEITETALYPDPPQGMPRMCDELCWRPIWSRDGLGRRTDYAYNPHGQLTGRTDPADADGVRRRTTISYTESGVRRRREVRVCGDITTCGTDQEIVTEYEYVGQTSLVSLERQRDPATGTVIETRYGYDTYGRLISTDGPLPGSDDAVYNRYDAHGRRSWEIGAAGAGGVRIARRHSYRDSDDRVVSTETGTVPDAASTALTVLSRTDFGYDDRRNPIWESVSAAGTTHNVTQRSFDASGRLVCSAVRMNPAAFAALPGDACVSGPPGDHGPDRITRTVYDEAGQRLQLREGVGVAGEEAAEATWAYNLNGQITQVVDGNGNRAELRYDGHGRQSCWIFPSTTRPPSYDDATPATALATAGSVNGDCIGSGDFEAYGHDAAGNRIWLRKRDGSVIGYQYDGLNRLVVKVVPERPSGSQALTAAQTRDVHYGYDLRDLMTHARFDSPTGEGVTNSYDAFGRLASSSIDIGGVTRTLAYQHDPTGNRTRITHPDAAPNGIWFATQYDAAGRPFYLDANGTTGIAYAFYAPHGGVSQINRVNAATGHSYDVVLRPSGLTQHRFGPAGDSVAWSYARNPAGQLSALTSHDPGPGQASADAFAWTGHYGVNRAYATNGLNQYTNAGPPGAQVAFSYDDNGNLTSDGARSYGYDVENRLVTASPGATLSYDPLGRLHQLAVDGAVRTTFLYDGDALVAEYDGAGAMTRRYAHWPGADVPMVSYEGETLATPTQLFVDHQGSIVAHADWSGNLVRINRYDEYGIPAATNAGRFQYTGQIWLAELGMYHYKARLYSPTFGRFLQVDPIGYDDQFNLYAYVGNDPVNGTDPDGKCRNRDTEGECVVTNRAGADGTRASNHLQAQVRRVDHAIRGLDRKQKIRVDVGNGRFREMTGAQVARAWARTDWVVDDNGGQNFANGFGAQIDSTGRFTGRPSYLERFRERAHAWGRNEDEATRSVVLHDFGHSTRVGRGISSLYRGSGVENFNSRERATSRLGEAIGNAIGETFECQTFLLGC